MTTSKDLPAIADQTSLQAYVANGKLKEALNQKPPESWLKAHPFAKNVVYLPIDKVEMMLDTMFQEWRVEVLNVQQLAQSICCTVRLHYRNPANNEWSYHDGVGAVPLKTDKGFSAADLSHIKSDAVQTGAPAAKSFAIKDAAEHLGKLFGRDINRKDEIGYKSVYADVEEEEAATDDETAGAIEAIKDAKNMINLQVLWSRLDNRARQHPEVIAAKDARKAEFAPKKENDDESH